MGEEGRKSRRGTGLHPPAFPEGTLGLCTQRAKPRPNAGVQGVKALWAELQGELLLTAGFGGG